MAAETVYGDPVPKVKSSKNSKPAVDACTNGRCGPTKRGSMSMSRFNPTKSRYNLPKGKKTKPEKEEPVKRPKGEGNMNVRDLSGNPGYPSYTSGSDRNPAERKKAEVTLTKKRRYF